MFAVAKKYISARQEKTFFSPTFQSLNMFSTIYSLLLQYSALLSISVCFWTLVATHISHSGRTHSRQEELLSLLVLSNAVAAVDAAP